MHTVAIDCRFASLHAGLGRYTRELVAALVARKDPWRYVLLTRGKGEAWMSGLSSSVECLEAPFPHYSLSEQMQLPRIIRDAKADLFFCPHFNVPLFCPVPFLVTVHDLILHRYPNRASLLKQTAYRFLMRKALQGSTAILTVSSFVGEELKQVYGPEIAAKMHVTFEGVSPHFGPRSSAEIQAVRARHGLDRPYFLYVGNAKQHKNVPMLLEAFNHSPLADAELVLVTGGNEVKALVLPDSVRLLPEVSDEDLPALYAGAKAFVTASLYEGFCLPAAEAIACGCPVIAVDRGPLREVTGGHALLVEPTFGALVGALRHPPADRTPRTLWHWEQAAERTAEVIGETFQRACSGVACRL